MLIQNKLNIAKNRYSTKKILIFFCNEKERYLEIKKRDENFSCLCSTQI